jgi:hypothetical protein
MIGIKEEIAQGFPTESTDDSFVASSSTASKKAPVKKRKVPAKKRKAPTPAKKLPVLSRGDSERQGLSPF